MSAPVAARTPAPPAAAPALSRAGPDLVQRKCACGGSAGLDGACEACRETRLGGRTGLSGDDERRPVVQPQLVVGPPDDEYEREAERMAELVTSEEAPEAGSETEEIEAAPPGGEEETEEAVEGPAPGAEATEEEETVQTKAVPGITPLVQRRAISMPPAAVEEEEEALEEPEEAEEPEEYVQTRADGRAETGTSSSPVVLQVQREAESAEDEEPEKEEEEEEEEEVQRRASLAMGGRDEGEVGPGLSDRLRAARRGGSPLPAATRAAMERAFGADFGSVRVHADSTADSLARSFRAHAFTTGEHIFFRDGQYDPSGSSGRRLLAHELTHVLQQKPDLQRANGVPGLQRRATGARSGRRPGKAPFALQASPELVQRDGPGGTSTGFVVVGQIRFFDNQSRELKVEGPGWQTDESVDMLTVGPGVYPAKITGTAGAYKLSFAGLTFSLIQTPSNLKQLLRQAKTILVVIFSNKTGLLKEEPLKPGVGGQAPAPPTPPGGQPGPKPGEAEKAEEAAKPGEGKKEGEAEEEGEEAAPGEKQGPAGSKYGWLNLIELPAPVIKALEVALELLSDAEEMEALVELLRLLSELGKHADELKAIFSDTDRLLLVALGIEESEAIKALEKWVEDKPRRRKRTRRRAKTKSVRKVVEKIKLLIEKVRRVLRPIFTLRKEFKTVLAGVAVFFEGVEGFEELLEAAKGGKDKAKLDELVEYVAAQLAARIGGRLEQAREGFKLAKEQFLESDLISYEELAGAVTTALLMLVPKLYRPIVKVGQELGLDTLVAENVIAPLIPAAVLDALNDQLRAITKKLDETFITAVETDLNAIFDGLGKALQENLEPALKKLVLQPRYMPGVRVPPPSSPRLLASIGEARGEGLPRTVRDEMEGAFAFRFDDVRIFHDGAAARATEMVGATAFTLGSNVYFGPGRFAPDSPEGRRLLAHELTHVVQQSQGARRGVIQRTWKEVRTKLVEKFGEVALEGLRGVFRAGAAKKAEAEKILKEVDRLVSGKKKVRQRTGPRLPIAYVYVRNSKGNITGIRRKLEWLSAVPALSINSKTRVIQLGFLSRYDPKKLDRARLRAALGCKPGYEAHHVIPLELRSESLVRIAVRNGWNFNGQENGLCLGGRVHSGSHPKYTGDVRARLRRLQGSAKYRGVTDWKVLQKPFQALVDQLKAELKQRRRKLD